MREMREDDNERALPEQVGRVTLRKPMGKALFRLLAFIGCVAVLVAAFAVSGIWTAHGELSETFLGGLFHRARETKLPETVTEVPTAPPEREQTEPEAPPEDAVAVVAQTLSEPVRPAAGEPVAWRAGVGGTVLIVCTDPREAYLADTADRLSDPVGNAVFSSDANRTVTAVAEALAGVLRANGIPVLVAMPEPGETLTGVYERAAGTIRSVLAAHPEVGCVIDVGRDSLFDASGNYIRTLANGDGEPTAQVLAILGDGTPNRRENLALAETLGAAMEERLPTVFRGVSLRETAQNQDLAPRTLTLRIGSGANTVGEAVRAAGIVGNALADLLKRTE